MTEHPPKQVWLTHTPSQHHMQRTGQSDPQAVRYVLGSDYDELLAAAARYADARESAERCRNGGGSEDVQRMADAECEQAFADLLRALSSPDRKINLFGEGPTAEDACRAALGAQASAVHEDLELAVAMLENGEYAEHWAKSELGKRLESALTRLHGDFSEASVSLAAQASGQKGDADLFFSPENMTGLGKDELIRQLQWALCYWMPNIAGDATPDGERCARDAALLYGMKIPAGREDENTPTYWEKQQAAAQASGQDATRQVAGSICEPINGDGWRDKEES